MEWQRAWTRQSNRSGLAVGCAEGLWPSVQSVNYYRAEPRFSGIARVVNKVKGSAERFRTADGRAATMVALPKQQVRKFFAILMLSLTASAQAPRIVSATQANGTYRYRNNEIRILALGHNKLRVQMDLVFAYKSPAGPTANTGEASGEATIENDVAVFYPMDDRKCKITIKFLQANKIKVSEENTIDCGFGMNVTSSGTYKKTIRGKPKFDDAR